MAFATHLECECSEESLKEKNRHLQDLADKYNCILTHKSKDEVIFAMNAMAREGQERGDNNGDQWRPMGTHETQRDYWRLMRPMGTHENQRD